MTNHECKEIKFVSIYKKKNKSKGIVEEFETFRCIECGNILKHFQIKNRGVKETR